VEFWGKITNIVSTGAAVWTIAGQMDANLLRQDVCSVAYGHRIERKDLPPRLLDLEWGSRLPDSIPISQVSVPGSHDAGTALGTTGDTRCQSLSIPAQLALGIRGFDIRLRLVHNLLGVYHHEESQQLSFATVIQSFREFLKAHPHEFLIMRVREESSAVDSREPFERAFANTIRTANFESYVYQANSRTEIPTVRQIRGKVVLLDNYGKLPRAIDYPNPTMKVQDDYDTSDMDKKYQEIESEFKDAIAEKSGVVWHVNYTSSSTSEVDQIGNARAVNPRVVRFLKGRKGHLGLVFMNFPGEPEIRSIVQSNFH
jgi:1-phosphatidylinositol phosphodiesterase